VKSKLFGVLQDRRAALVIAHPGHELCVYNWVSLARPGVFVLTDGSSHSGKSRLHRTTSILNSLGVQRGCIYGRMTDVEIYSAILNADFDLFIGTAQELAEALVSDRIDYVVGDAIEGYNPAHDICRLIINAAVNKACQMGHWVENFDVLLAGTSADLPADAISIEVDDKMLLRKLQAARDYSEMAVHLHRILDVQGIDSLRTERLRRVKEDSGNVHINEPPYYEIYGEKQVAAGYYQQVIRYREHFLPIAQVLRQFVASRSRAANCGY
jgi:hypothetical protein